MSLSAQDRQQNPSKFFLEVRSGVVRYYDKENAENVNVPIPFEFIVLDQLGAVKGWSDADNSGFWSNQVRSSNKDPFTIHTTKGVKATGLWKEIKTIPALAGAKFNASVYIAHKSGDGLVMSNIVFQGAALNAWIDFIQANKGVMKGRGKVVLSGFSDGKKGSVSFKTPIFEVLPISANELSDATTLDLELQEYLKEYFGSDDEAPALADKDVVIEDIDDREIDLSLIPF